MKNITSPVNRKIVVFCTLSIAVHMVVIFVTYKSTLLLPSAQSTPQETTLQLSFVKPVSVTTQIPTPGRSQQLDAAITTAKIQAPLPPTNKPKTKDSPESIKPATKQNSNQRVIKVNEFVTFLNRSESSQTVRWLAQATRSLQNQQRQSERHQQHELQIDEKTRIVAQRLNLAFSEHFTYPRLAQRNGWQGMVKLGLRIEPNGQLSRIRVVSTSGFPVLDQAALETLYRISTLQGVDPWLNGTPFDTVLPVEYRLLGG